MHRAYKAHIISTIVDVLLSSIDACAYKAHIISTIVDMMTHAILFSTDKLTKNTDKPPFENRVFTGKSILVNKYLVL